MLGVGIVGLYSYVALDNISNRIISKKYISQDSNSYHIEDLLIGLSTPYLTKKKGTMPTDKEINGEVQRRWKWIQLAFNEHGGGEKGAKKMLELFYQNPPDNFRI